MYRCCFHNPLIGRCKCFPSQHTFEIVNLTLLSKFLEIVVLISNNGIVMRVSRKGSPWHCVPLLAIFLSLKSVSSFIKYFVEFLWLTWSSLVRRKESFYFTWCCRTSSAVLTLLIIYWVTKNPASCFLVTWFLNLGYIFISQNQWE